MQFDSKWQRERRVFSPNSLSSLLGGDQPDYPYPYPLSPTSTFLSQCLPAALGGGRGLDVSVGGVRRQRRDVRVPLVYEDQLMQYPAGHGGGGVNDLYYQSDDWRGQGLDQALQRLVERDKRREQEEEQRAG